MSRPEGGNPDDRRCGLIDERPGDHTLQEGDEDWCYGCKFYICEGCSKNHELPFGLHAPKVHLEEEEDEPDADDEDVVVD